MNLTLSDAMSLDGTLPPGARAIFNPGAPVYSVAFSPDGQLLASGGDDNAVILWDVDDASEREIFIEHSKSVMSIAFSPNGQILASASLDGFVRLWDVASGGKRTSLRHNGWVESVTFSPDGKTLVSGGGDREGFFTFWDVRGKQRISTVPGHESIVESVAFSPDGQMLASASRDKSVKVWDATGQHMLKKLTGHNRVVLAVAFSPDSETLATSSRDNTIKLWDISSGKNFATFEIKNSLYAYAESIAFSPDGQTLASACVDYTIRLWDVVEHREAATLRGHHSGVTSVAFSPDGGFLASGSRDRTVLLWNLSHFGVEVSPILPSRQDTTPPNIVIRSPLERIVNSTVGKVPVKVTVTDNTRIAEVWISGRKATVLEADGFSATVPLEFGENNIRITATDAHGNIETLQFIVVREAPSHIDTIPPDILIHTTSLRPNQLTVDGNVMDDSGIAEVWINGMEAAVSETGAFTTTIPLKVEENEIRIIATDAFGNAGTLYRKVEDTEGPDIHILSVEKNAERAFQEPSILVSGTVRDPSGVAQVKVNGIQAQVIGEEFTASIQLDYEDDLIRVTATDLLDNQAFMEIPLPDPIPRPGKDYALLFAVDTYIDWPGLRYPLVDALKISQDLKDIYGFEVELVQNPTKMDIHRILREYVRKEYGPNDQLLIFFAGHGDFDMETNMGYLVCQDAKKPENDRFRVSSFSHSDFRDIIDRMSCKHIFLVMDTCYSGTFDERLAMRGESENVSKSLSQADIQRIMTYTTRRYLTSGANEQVPDKSLFVRALLEALRSKGGGDNILTTQEILTYVENVSNPKPCFGEFGRNAPGSDFLFITK